MDSITSPRIPVIDLSEQNLQPGTGSWLSACNEIKFAFEEFGCFVAVYNKLTSEYGKKVFNAVEELFDLPQETKTKNVNPKIGHGYLNIPTLPRFEGLSIDYATNLEACKNFTTLMWPEGNDQFCEIAHTYGNLVAELQQLVMRMLFESYGIDEKHYETQRESTIYPLRFVKYRRVHTTEQKVNLDGGHTHKSLMSIVHSDDVMGWNLRTKEGEWMHFEPSPSTYIVFAGDVAMAWSNDRIKSCYHRATVDRNKTRYPLTLFAFLSGVIKTQEEFIDEDHPLKYKPFDNLGLLRFFKSSNDPSAALNHRLICITKKTEIINK